MASTYSSLKIQLMATGENAGTWGNVTNDNLGIAIEEAIVGSADVTFASADVTLTLTDTNATQTARNLRLNLTGTVAAPQNLIVPAIEKVYIINNGLSQTITVKNSTGTGIAVPTGKTMYVYNNGTNVVDVITHLTSLTLGTPLAVAQGGTGSTTATFSGENITSLNASNVSSGTLANARTTAASANGASTIVARGASGEFAAGTITATFSGNGSSVTFINASNIATGTIANDRTTASASNGASTIVARDASGNFTGFNVSATNFIGTLNGSGANVTSLNADNISSGTLAVARGGTGSTTATFSGANITSLNANNISTGTLAVARGGTGATSLTAENVILGNSTNAVKFVAPGANGNLLTSNGTTWTSAAPPASGVTSLNGQTGAITNTNLDAIGSYICALRGTTHVTGVTAINGTIAGSSLRYGYTTDTANNNDFSGAALTSSGTNYTGGGTALSGTWRCLGRDAQRTSGCNYLWFPGLWVRIS